MNQLTNEEIQVYSKGSDIDTIKFIRKHRNIGLKEAHDLVMAHKNPPPRQLNDGWDRERDILAGEDK